MPKLTHQQKRFAESYIKSFDAGRSAIEAGYSEKSAPSQGSKLLRKPQVSAYINQLSAEIQEKTEVEVGEVIAELRKIAFALPDKKVSNSDRLKALELLGKTLRIFTESFRFEQDQIKPVEMSPEQEADYKRIAQLMTSAGSHRMSLDEYLATYPDRLPRLSG